MDSNRLLAIAQTPLRSVEEGIDDLMRMKNQGMRGVMMPGNPGTEFDYDDPQWDPFWQAAIDLQLPLSWHILTTRESGRPRGPKANSFMTIIRANQDIMGTLVFGGVFERNEGLKVVCVEADAGWVPHYMYRMDHAQSDTATGCHLDKSYQSYLASISVSTSTPLFRTTGLPSKWWIM